MPANIKQQYLALKNKFNLPPFEEADKEFDIRGIEEASFSLKSIIKKMLEKAEFFSKLFEDILQPDTTPASLHECSVFDEAEKKKILEIYKKLYYINRSYVELELIGEEKKYAEFLRWLYQEWKQTKQAMLPIIQKLKNSWLKKTDTKTELEYFG